MNELSLVFVRREVAQVAPGSFVAGLAGPSHSRRGVLAGGPPDAPGVDGCDLRARCSDDVVGSAPGDLQGLCALPGFNNCDVIIIINPLP
mgnify:CR=1 FL=1